MGSVDAHEIVDAGEVSRIAGADRQLVRDATPEERSESVPDRPVNDAARAIWPARKVVHPSRLLPRPPPPASRNLPAAFAEIGQAGRVDERQPEIDVRGATPDEALVIAEVWLRSRHASVPAIPPPVHSDDEVRGWFADVVLPTREVWVAAPRSVPSEAGGPTIVAVLVLDGDWLDQLHVDPGWFGRGIGSMLVDRAKAERPDGLDLWTFASNAGARRLYERHGFVAVDATDGDNEEGDPDIRYHWPAPPPASP